jgi:hypothetical protein
MYNKMVECAWDVEDLGSLRMCPLQLLLGSCISPSMPFHIMRDLAQVGRVQLKTAMHCG